MRKREVIYICGPITDNSTGLEREGWRDDFLEAERKLRGMGFPMVLNPADIADETEAEWKALLDSGRLLRELGVEPTEKPARCSYISSCIQTLETMAVYGVRRPTGRGRSLLAGLYAIGSKKDILASYGTMCEINFALSAGLPVWLHALGGMAVDNMLRPCVGQPELGNAPFRLPLKAEARKAVKGKKEKKEKRKE